MLELRLAYLDAQRMERGIIARSRGVGQRVGTIVEAVDKRPALSEQNVGIIAGRYEADALGRTHEGEAESMSEILELVGRVAGLVLRASTRMSGKRTLRQM